MRLCRGLRLAVVVGLVGCGSDDVEYGSRQPGTASTASTTGGIAGSTGSISASPATLHALLDDDIEAQGLLPCTLGACGAVLTPLVVPDTLLLDLDRPSGFPNGRALPDPVFDRMLAAILLDADAHPITTLSSIPPSPADNDVQFYDEFLAAPH